MLSSPACQVHTASDEYLTYHCNKDVSRCQYAQHFAVQMKKYYQSEETPIDHDIEHLKRTLESYLHVVGHHSHMKPMRDMLGECDTATCEIFARFHRRRDRTKHVRKPETDGAREEYSDMMDKMHCHFHDVSKRVGCNKRYNQFVFGGDINKLSQDDKPRKSAHKVYQVGFKFHYGDDDTYWKRYGDDDADFIVYPKYFKLKEETTVKADCSLSPQQFDKEFKKALILFSTEFRKQTYPVLTVYHLLAVLIYCNYDEYQHQLSKSYRIDNGSLHENYYWIGMFLREAVNDFGFEWKCRDFYHGVADKLIFLYRIGRWESYIHVYGPLSTSSSIEVAASFTDYGNGLIASFNTAHAGYSSVCLSVSWLSDYGYESEHLFVQNRGGLVIANIIQPATGVEYKLIFEALQNLYSMHSSNSLNEHDWKRIADGPTNEVYKKIFMYQADESLDEYTKMICEWFFGAHRRQITFDVNIWQRLRGYNIFDDDIMNLFYHCKDGVLSPDLEFIGKLCPKVKRILLVNCQLSDMLISKICDDLLKADSISCICIYPSHNGHWQQLVRAVRKYCTPSLLIQVTSCEESLSKINGFEIRRLRNAEATCKEIPAKYQITMTLKNNLANLFASF